MIQIKKFLLLIKWVAISVIIITTGGLIFLEFPASIDYNSFLKEDENGKIAHEYLEKQGYRVISFKEGKETVLTKKELFKDGIVWGHQRIDHDSFIGQKMEFERFVVQNHPLDSLKNQLIRIHLKPTGATSVTIIINNKKVIGGKSNPITKVHTFGGCYSLEGKTLTEVV